MEFFFGKNGLFPAFFDLNELQIKLKVFLFPSTERNRIPKEQIDAFQINFLLNRR